MQESLASEYLDSGGVFPVLVFPVVPFITKFNRYIVLGLLVVGKFGNNFKAIPDGFSKEKGNYIYKEYHVGYAGGSGVLLGIWCRPTKRWCIIVRTG